MKENITEISKSIGKIRNHQDAWYILCKLSQSTDKTKANTYNNTDKNILQITFEEVIKNEIFINNLIKLSIKKKERPGEKDPWDESDKSQLQLMKLFLQIGFFPTSIFLEKLNLQSVQGYRFFLKETVKNLEKKLEYKYSSENILMIFVEIAFNKKSKYTEEFPLTRLKTENIDGNLFYNRLKTSDSLIIATLSAIPYLNFISISIKNTESTLANRLCNLYGASAASAKKIEVAAKRYQDTNPSNDSFTKYIKNLRNTNEKIINFIIEVITGKMQYNKEIESENSLFEKITKSDELEKIIIDYCTNNLSAFKSNIQEKSTEWSNKIFIITIELLSVLKIVKNAKNIEWKQKITYWSFVKWLNELHEIINRDELIDDWNNIVDSTREENDFVEWKSSFELSLENDEAKNDELILKITHAILGMMNGIGGVIIVGLIEYPERISKKEILENCIKKNGLTFFDINYEWQITKRNADEMKKILQDKLKTETLLDINKLDKLWNLSEIVLIDESNNKKISVYKISVEKSKNKVYCSEKYKDGFSVKLIQRVKNRTIYVDPRENTKIENDNYEENQETLSQNISINEKRKSASGIKWYGQRKKQEYNFFSNP